jgi:hypothetical protein
LQGFKAINGKEAGDDGKPGAFFKAFIELVPNLSCFFIVE